MLTLHQIVDRNSNHDSHGYGNDRHHEERLQSSISVPISGPMESGLRGLAMNEGRHSRGEKRRLNRLGQIRLEAGIERLRSAVPIHVGAHGRSRKAVGVDRRPNPANQRISIFVGHGDIAEQNIRETSSDLVQCLTSGPDSGGFGPELFEDRCERRSRISFIVDDKYTHAGQQRSIGSQRTGCALRQCGVSQQRQGDRKRRTAALSGTRRGNLSSVTFDKVLGDSEAEPQAAVCTRRRTVSLLKTIEDPSQQGRVHADAGVLNHNSCGCIDPVDSYVNRAVLRSEFQRIIQEIRDHLLNPLRIRFEEQPRFNRSPTIRRPSRER